jgi:hypothetical protein
LHIKLLCLAILSGTTEFWRFPSTFDCPKAGAEGEIRGAESGGAGAFHLGETDFFKQLDQVPDRDRATDSI